MYITISAHLHHAICITVLKIAPTSINQKKQQRTMLKRTDGSFKCHRWLSITITDRGDDAFVKFQQEEREKRRDKESVLIQWDMPDIQNVHNELRGQGILWTWIEKTNVNKDYISNIMAIAQKTSRESRDEQRVCKSIQVFGVFRKSHYRQNCWVNSFHFQLGLLPKFLLLKERSSSYLVVS